MAQIDRSSTPGRRPGTFAGFLRLLRGEPPCAGATAGAAALGELRATCAGLEERLATTDRLLRERTKLLYEMQRHYASEHFDLQESMRNLKIEELRRAGVHADRELMGSRQRLFIERIRELKDRLRRHEPCEDEWIDEASST